MFDNFRERAASRGYNVVIVEQSDFGKGTSSRSTKLVPFPASLRARFAAPLVALTGSNGKTTVKEMLAAILAAHAGATGAILATRGNLNNDIGMPLTLLELRRAHRFAVIDRAFREFRCS